MSKGYGRWTQKSDEWSRLVDTISCRIDDRDYDEVIQMLENANVRERLTMGELNWLGEFVICLVRSATSK